MEKTKTAKSRITYPNELYTKTKMLQNISELSWHTQKKKLNLNTGQIGNGIPSHIDFGSLDVNKMKYDG